MTDEIITIEAILNIPADYIGARGGGDIYQYAQTVHQKPIIGGYISRAPNYVFSTRDQSNFIQAIEHHEYDRDKRLRLSKEGLQNIGITVQDLNLRYVIAHRNIVSTYKWSNLVYFLNKGLGRPIYEDQLIRVYNGYRSD